MSTLTRGLLVVIEGVDGAGKSTLAAALKEHLQGREIPVVASKEPTDGYWGKRIKSLRYVVERGNVLGSRQVTPREELKLFINDRKEHVEKVINPALKEKKLVLLDRYYFSSVAYQGALEVEGMDPEEIKRMNEEFAPPPDLVLLLTVPPGAGLSRITKNRKKRLDAFEREEYLSKVQKIFSELTEPYIQRIDASRAKDEVIQDAVVALEKLLAKVETSK